MQLSQFGNRNLYLYRFIKYTQHNNLFFFFQLFLIYLSIIHCVSKIVSLLIGFLFIIFQLKFVTFITHRCFFFFFAFVEQLNRLRDCWFGFLCYSHHITFFHLSFSHSMIQSQFFFCFSKHFFLLDATFAKQQVRFFAFFFKKIILFLFSLHYLSAFLT